MHRSSAPVAVLAAAVGALLAGAVVLAFASAATANTFTVTKRGDPVPDACKPRDCSLREAVLRANARDGRDVIVLPGRRGAYRLAQAGSGEDAAATGDLDVTDGPLVIRHRGRGRATIDAREIDRAFDVLEGAPTTFVKLVIRGGVTDDDEGGGIGSESDLRVIQTRVVGNRTEGANYGAGIGLTNDAGLQLVDSVVAGNESGSDGGGIDADSGPVVILRSRIADNEAEGGGGGLYYNSGGPSRIVASTIDRNRADAGGAIQVTGASEGPALRIVRTTISRNRAVNGGGLNVRSPLRVTNTTVALNRADSDGGGLLYGNTDPVVGLNAVTIARNVADADDAGGGSGGGLFRSSMNGLVDAFAVENSLIGLNRLGSEQRNDCDGIPVDSLGGNVLSTVGPADACDGFTRPTDRVRGNPRIGPLRRNGGPTETIALLTGSVAINRAKRNTAPNRDQRGEARGTKKDVGAFERNLGR